MTDDVSSLVERVGIWRAFGELKLKDLLWPEGTVAFVVGVGGASYIANVATLKDRLALALPIAGIGGAFLAVIFTALAIVVSLPSSSYLRMLAETANGGMWRFLSPFLLAIGEQIVVIMLALAYAVLARHVSHQLEVTGFVALGFLLIFGLFDIAALGRQLVKHGILRAEDAALEKTEADIRRLPAARR